MFQTPGILSSSEFRGFWITTEYVNNDLVIKVGKEGEREPFLTGTDTTPLQIQNIGLSSWVGQSATFKLIQVNLLTICALFNMYYFRIRYHATAIG